jgi:hypothetical protein
MLCSLWHCVLLFCAHFLILQCRLCGKKPALSLPCVFPRRHEKDAGPKQPSFDPAPGSAFRVIMLLLIGVRWLDILASILWAALFLFEVVIVRPLQAFHNLPRHSKSVV